MSAGIEAVDERLSSLDNASLVALKSHVPLDALRTRFDKGIVVTRLFTKEEGTDNESIVP